MKKTIGPNDVLLNGTKISIKNMKGHIVNHEIVDAVPSGKITVHTVMLTHKVVQDVGWKFKTVPLKKPIQKKVNYSAIYLYDKV